MIQDIIQRIEEHFRANRRVYVQRFSRPTGTMWAAEDVVQTTYERAIRYAASYRGEQSLDAWIWRIGRNALIDWLNEERGISYEEFDEFEFEAPKSIDTTALYLSVERWIQEENEDVQPLLQLHFLQGFSIKEVYQCNRYTYPNTRKIIQRFRDKVKKRLRELEE